ncbi:MAG: large subunit ribosomal protein L25 [Candidatus Berkelbacteria bacterium Athens1014_28]|uniref:Large ribosomal subunit protein bL25 n=1 Tax=Candidatus Berkelbacteria bacterium Athens1014_28 TaxID=2017145 RepID=A0A554LLL7_9BACT|nr:MAG: large subunit ribosomal protein L25 [Candidatus Berkelbacteria bacterium Athens1014_28]
MTEEYNLTASVRKSEKAKVLRQGGQLPAVVYGNDFENQNISLVAKNFNKIFAIAGESSLIDLSIDNITPIKVLVHDYQINPVTSEIIHVDFYKVNMREKIKTEIPIKEVGESSAVLDLEGTLVTNRDSIEVECLPSDLVHEIEVDISILKTFDDVIHISDLKIPASIEVLNDPEEVVFLIQPPRSEEELAELEEKPVEKVEEVEVEGEKKEEEVAEDDNAEAPVEENKE